MSNKHLKYSQLYQSEKALLPIHQNGKIKTLTIPALAAGKDVM
jgi:hypothetical protein